MNMGKKMNYESPFVKKAQVETESGFCAASIIQDPDKQGVKTQGHEIGGSYEFGSTNGPSEWQDSEWQ